MKIERIGHNKIKITLSIGDLEEWNVDFENLSYNSPEAQEMFWNIMRRAEIETGFYVDDSQLIIEAMPLRSDSFVVFITRVDEDEDFESIHKYIKSKFKKSELRVKKKSKKISSGIIMFMFSTFEDVCMACSSIYDIYSGESTLYKYGDCYYLCLTRNSNVNSKPHYIETMLCEYGRKLSNPFLQEGFLNEYAEKIIEDHAVETLKKYFSS